MWLNIVGINKFYYLRNFTNSCKYDGVFIV